LREHCLAIRGTGLASLLELDNVVLLPHIGSATHQGRSEMGEKVIVNVKSFVDGHTPPDKVVYTMY
jgi:glyoxylate reductase